MTTTPSLSVVEDLVWLQRFAARIASEDPEDLAQDAALAASRADEAVGRGWLATVLRNRLRMRDRSDAARRAREREFQAAAAPAVGEEARAHRLKVLGALVEAVEALPDTDRAIVLGRFFDGQSATQLGEALGMPAATVRSRLKRALERLRTRLDERFEGERVTWAAVVLAPASTMEPAAVTAGATATLLGAKAIFVAVATVAIGVGVWLGMRPPPEPRAQAVPVAVEEDAAAKTSGSVAPASDAERQWTRRKQRIVAATRRAADEEPADDVGLPAPDADADVATDEAIAAQSQAFLDCAADLDIPVTGAIVLRSRILGAPDVGTIYESVDIVGQTENREEIVECVRESMFAYLGDGPAEPFDRVRTVTTLGRRPKDLDDDAWARRIFDTVVTAHLAEVEACAAGTAVATSASLTMTFTDEPVAADVQVRGVPADAADCIVDEARAWMFPRRFLEDRTFTRSLGARPPGAE